MGNVVMFPTHKVRKPKTNSASKQTEEQSKKAKENLYDKRPFAGLPTWFKGYKLSKK